MKHLFKGLGIAAAAVASLTVGYVLADKIVAKLPGQVSAKARQWIASAVAFFTALTGAVVASKLLGKYIKGGPSVSAQAK